MITNLFFSLTTGPANYPPKYNLTCHYNNNENHLGIFVKDIPAFSSAGAPSTFDGANSVMYP